MFKVEGPLVKACSCQAAAAIDSPYADRARGRDHDGLTVGGNAGACLDALPGREPVALAGCLIEAAGGLGLLAGRLADTGRAVTAAAVPEAGLAMLPDSTEDSGGACESCRAFADAEGCAEPAAGAAAADAAAAEVAKGDALNALVPARVPNAQGEGCTRLGIVAGAAAAGAAGAPDGPAGWLLEVSMAGAVPLRLRAAAPKAAAAFVLFAACDARPGRGVPVASPQRL